jgi:Xaa-Pro aminopeptidase
MEIVEEGCKAEIEAAKPGARDWDVWAAAQYGMMRNGSEMPVHCNWISGKNPVRTLTRPSMRLLEHGDLIINELEANWVGYRAQGVQPVFVGAANPVHQELIKVQREIFNRVMEKLKPGVSVKISRTGIKSQRASAKIRSSHGARGNLHMHGRGQRRRTDHYRPRQEPAPIGSGDAREYGFYLQAVRHQRRRHIDLQLGRQHCNHRQRWAPARQTAP